MKPDPVRFRVRFFAAAGLLLWPVLAKAQLTAVDVQTIIDQATTRALQISPNSVIAVTDREGDVLAVWSVNGTPPSALDISSCVSKAGTASYLSSNQNAFTSRTAGFIIQQHFPPGVRNTSPGPLVGVGLFSPQQMIEVDDRQNDTEFGAQLEHDAEEGNGIGSA